MCDEQFVELLVEVTFQVKLTKKKIEHEPKKCEMDKGVKTTVVRAL